MNAMELSARLSLDANNFNKGIKNAESGFKSFGQKLTAIGAKMATAVVAGTTAAVAGVAAIGKKSVDAYAQFEQLEGGIETLFKESAGTMKRYAEEAYKTAGVSANQYMEMSTSFAASLIQGLGGNTQQAAEMANMAIIDMSDNANKMGTDISMIQSAYQGFAKQNYTMLDNLKLGYGGTKTEMVRLINDSGVLGKKIKDLDGVTFDQIVSAIHKVQEQMGITGTTSKEASTTIEGSMKMAKAAWEDMLVAMTKPGKRFNFGGDSEIKKATNKLVESIKTALSNVLPAIRNFVTGFGSVVAEIAPMIGEELPQLIADFLPGFIDAGWKLIQGLGKGIEKAAKKIKWPTWKDVGNAIGKAWQGIQKGVDALGGLIFGRKTDGSIDWPTWEKVGKVAEAAWNTIVEGVKGLGKIIFGENVDITIGWPTWGEISSAVTTAWNAIIDGINGLGKIIFGENVDGTVDWPTWGEIGEAITGAWNDIISGVEGLAKLIFGENVDGTVDWPTWDEIGSSITSAWNVIVSGVEGLAKLVFGENVDGTVDWPTWDSIGTALTDAWNVIISGVDGLGAIVFGKNVDGTIKWPTWEDIGTALTQAWNVIVDEVSKLGKIIFGENVDGTVNWPTWEKIGTDLTNAWNAIVEGVSSLGKIVFDKLVDGNVNWPAWSSLKDSFDTWWNDTFIPSAQAAMTWTLSLFGMPETTAESITTLFTEWWSGLKSVAESAIEWFLGAPGAPHATGEQIHNLILGWWNNIKSIALSAIEWLFPNATGMSDADGASAKEILSGWWENYVKPFLGDILNFTLGLFGLPDASEMANAIKEWWEEVKKLVGKLAYNVFVRPLFGSAFEGGSGGPEFGSEGDHLWSGFSGTMDSDSGTRHYVPQPKAIGDWNVPYDNFPALLHRNEMVLTASQARKLRNGELGGGFDPGVLADAMRSAIIGLPMMLNDEVVGRVVGNSTTGRVHNNIGQIESRRRFGFGG